MMPDQQSYPTFCGCFCIFCHCSHVEPIFICSLSNLFCAARSTFKALNIIHYNAVHSQLRLLVECGKCTICTSPPLSFSTLALPCLLLTRCHSTDQEPAFQKQRNVLLIEDGCRSFQLSAELSNGAFFNRTPSCMHFTVSAALYQRCNCDYLDLCCTQNVIYGGTEFCPSLFNFPLFQILLPSF